jgi:hypothetical protein
MKKDLNKLSFSELKTQIENLEKKKEKVTTKKRGCWEIGKNYVIRTVTMIQVGKLLEVGDKELVLEDAAWVADTGRWKNFLHEGKTSEVEPFPDGTVIVGRGSIIDATIWKHELLRNQK